MCGRYVTKAAAELERFWNITRGGIDFGGAFNAAPTQRLPIIRLHQGERALTLMRWGLVFSSAKDTKAGANLINARGETVAIRPAFRAAFMRRRCLVPMTGYYEWQQTSAGKVPHYIHLLNAEQFAVAGLYEYWPGRDGKESVESFTVVTTEPNEMTVKIHDRMPVILPADAQAQWLDPRNAETEGLRRLLRPYPAEEMRAYPVSLRVNSARNEGPELIEPVNDPRA
ncbi:MAG: SOS response-associated peptidase [Burkholderiales bacterium]